MVACSCNNHTDNVDGVCDKCKAWLKKEFDTGYIRITEHKRLLTQKDDEIHNWKIIVESRDADIRQLQEDVVAMRDRVLLERERRLQYECGECGQRLPCPQHTIIQKRTPEQIRDEQLDDYYGNITAH
jgi:hypothetical protein